MYGKQATVLYGVLFTGTGMASLVIVGLVLSPFGESYYLLFYLFGALSLISLIILVFFFKQSRYVPDWEAILLVDDESEDSDLSDQFDQASDANRQNPKRGGGFQLLSSIDENIYPSRTHGSD